jgi:hypothetical protein
MVSRPLTDDEWQRVVEDFDAVCAVNNGLFDQLWETLHGSAQLIVPDEEEELVSNQHPSV